VTVF